MACLKECKEGKLEGDPEEFTLDGSVDWHCCPAIIAKSGTWVAGNIILWNQGLATLAFFGIGVNLVLFLARVMGQDNADAANNVSSWIGTAYLFSLVGAFLSDSYWGRYKTCAIFQTIFVIGLVSLSLLLDLFLIAPKGCGNESIPCGKHSILEMGIFYLSIYLIALGNGGYQPIIATFGADQFDEEHSKEGYSKVAFFSYFNLAFNLGQLFSNTILVYVEDKGKWALGFWVSAGSAFAALILFLVGTPRYRHFKPSGSPLSRICQVLVAALWKWRAEMPSHRGDLYLMDENESSTNGNRKVLKTQGFKFLDKAAFISSRDLEDQELGHYNPWHICPITQVEEVKCVLRLLPIWLCTIMYSMVYAQSASIFVEQGAAMKTRFSHFRIPPASMSSFDIFSVAIFIFLYRRVLNPLTELERMGIGLVTAVMAMVSAGIVECYRLKYAKPGCSLCSGTSSLSILWQIPQYALVGASEVFMYVGQLEFFNAQIPGSLKSFGSALCMASISLGNYLSTLLVSLVMKISTKDHMPGWIPGNLNKGHLDRLYFLLACLTAIDLTIYIACAKWFKSIQHTQEKDEP
ncbi:protein NRT1/ PTR FAMILY 7.3-like [Abrus precatorius]|uniref:Protein NRT1/ PTR FAMILY 7.3-like n=1 Tax=Abrus precatorius TaxID=3816 RepID=A0A8B8K0Z9_ABRPR|nr:protein NRT1/ PTR FAMILY 7.3-like [Abrus precatorius]